MITVPTAQLLDARQRVLSADTIRAFGRVQQVVGLVIESSGPEAKIGDLCAISLPDQTEAFAEVVGFRGNSVLLMPFDEIVGIGAGNRVRNTGSCLRVPVGDQLLGRILDGIGNPLEGAKLQSKLTYPIHNTPPSALKRKIISKPMSTGVRVVDALTTTGVGQRVGIFAGSGVGKSTLLGMIARNSSADVNVIALVGERGREVREFIEHDLGPSGLAKSVLVIATSEQPALVRIKAAFTATAIAESFRDRGKNVMLMMDSVTRFATAQRELGLAIGEPPSTRGYTPSVFALLPRLLERAGTSDRGSITGIYTVLVEGDDTNEPVSDATRAILDGHIILDRKLANAGHFPAIAVGESLSRVMPNIVNEKHVRASNRLRELVSAYRDVEELVAIGAYQKGSKPIADEAIDKWTAITEFLRQDRGEITNFEDAVAGLEKLTNA